jgi:UV DNA damage repair endonuclease
MPINDPEKNKAYQLEWYHNNKKRLRDNRKIRYTNNKNLIDTYKEKLGCICTLCGVQDHPIAFDFHHVNHKEKENTISQMASYRWEKIKAEIDKCILICVICHRKLHKGLVELI